MKSYPPKAHASVRLELKDLALSLSLFDVRLDDRAATEGCVAVMRAGTKVQEYQRETCIGLCG